MQMRPVNTRNPWDDADVKELLAVYVQFLNSEDACEKYNKAAAMRTLGESQGRTKSSVECKMMNVSAVLDKHGVTYVPGLKPLKNFSKALEGQVRAFGLLDAE